MSTQYTVRAVLEFQKSPMTVSQLAKRTGLTSDGAVAMMNRLKSLGYVEFKAWGDRSTPKAPPPAVYGWKE